MTKTLVATHNICILHNIRPLTFNRLEEISSQVHKNTEMYLTSASERVS